MMNSCLRTFILRLSIRPHLGTLTVLLFHTSAESSPSAEDAVSCRPGSSGLPAVAFSAATSVAAVPSPPSPPSPPDSVRGKEITVAVVPVCLMCIDMGGQGQNPAGNEHAKVDHTGHRFHGSPLGISKGKGARVRFAQRASAPRKWSTPP